MFLFSVIFCGILFQVFALNIETFSFCLFLFLFVLRLQCKECFLERIYRNVVVETSLHEALLIRTHTPSKWANQKPRIFVDCLLSFSSLRLYLIVFTAFHCAFFWPIFRWINWILAWFVSRENEWTLSMRFNCFCLSHKRQSIHYDLRRQMSTLFTTRFRGILLALATSLFVEIRGFSVSEVALWCHTHNLKVKRRI